MKARGKLLMLAEARVPRRFHRPPTAIDAARRIDAEQAAHAAALALVAARYRFLPVPLLLAATAVVLSAKESPA